MHNFGIKYCNHGMILVKSAHNSFQPMTASPATSSASTANPTPNHKLSNILSGAVTTILSLRKRIPVPQFLNGIPQTHINTRTIGRKFSIGEDTLPFFANKRFNLQKHLTISAYFAMRQVCRCLYSGIQLDTVRDFIIIENIDKLKDPVFQELFDRYKYDQINHLLNEREPQFAVISEKLRILIFNKYRVHHLHIQRLLIIQFDALNCYLGENKLGDIMLEDLRAESEVSTILNELKQLHVFEFNLKQIEHAQLKQPIDFQKYIFFAIVLIGSIYSFISCFNMIFYGTCIPSTTDENNIAAFLRFTTQA